MLIKEDRKPMSLRKKLFLVVLCLFLSTCLFVGWKLYAAFTARPVIAVNYFDRLMILSNEQQTIGENGWQTILDAANVMSDVDNVLLEQARSSANRPGLNLKAVLNGEASAEEIEVANEAISMLTKRGAFDLMDQTRSYDYFLDSGPYDLSITLFTRSLAGRGSIRQLARAQFITFRHSAASGEMQEALKIVERILPCAQAISMLPSVIDRLVAVSIVSSMLEEVRLAIMSDSLDGESCQRLLGLINQHLHFPSYTYVFETERMNMLDMLQRVHTEDGNGDGELLLYEVSQHLGDTSSSVLILRFISAWNNLNPGAFAGRAEATELTNAQIDRAIIQAEHPWYERSGLPRIQESLSEAEKKRRLVVTSMMPHLEIVIRGKDDYDLLSRGVMLMLALEAHREKYGAYPEHLVDLDPEILDPLPIDPYSGKDFGYQREATGEEPQSYALYSIGPDGKDNGGRYWNEHPLLNGINESVARSVDDMDCLINYPKKDLASDF